MGIKERERDIERERGWRERVKVKEKKRIKVKEKKRIKVKEKEREWE